MADPNSAEQQADEMINAEGRCVAKGAIGTFSCDNSINSGTGLPNNGFTLTNSYALGLGGEQVTEMGGDGQWLHTNVFVGGTLLATYDDGGVHFHLDDWLGNRRVQADYLGTVEATYQNLPFGEMVPQNNSFFLGATEHHFTGKERDAESGNDFFNARYYNSATGRFLSPDWSAQVEPVPYAKLGNPQSLNLYAYVGNNPMNRIDLDGHFDCKGGADFCFNQNMAAFNIHAAASAGVPGMQDVSKALGKFGDHNGVVVQQGDLGAPDSKGLYTGANASMDGKTITFNNNSQVPKYSADQDAVTLVHEGTHIFQDNERAASPVQYTGFLGQLWGSLTGDGGSRTFHDNYRLEYEAYQNQGYMEQYLHYAGQIYDPTLSGNAESTHEQQQVNKWATIDACTETAGGCAP